MYRAASFLDDRILTSDVKGSWVSLGSVLDAAQAIGERKPLHFIFHTGHVGSTLLSRLLDESGCVLSLREPLPLRTLADARDVLGLPESLLSSRDFDALEQALLRLWSRGYPEHSHASCSKPPAAPAGSPCRCSNVTTARTRSI